MDGLFDAYGKSNPGIAHTGSPVQNVHADAGIPDGAELKSYSPKTYGTLLPAEDVRRVIPLLRAVCDYGTASPYLSGLSYECAGKTGTAEVNDEGRSNSWYVGFAGEDIDKPEIVVSVVVEDYSENGISGTSVARNIFDEFFN